MITWETTAENAIARIQKASELKRGVNLSAEEVRCFMFTGFMNAPGPGEQTSVCETKGKPDVETD